MGRKGCAMMLILYTAEDLPDIWIHRYPEMFRRKDWVRPWPDIREALLKDKTDFTSGLTIPMIFVKPMDR